MPQQPLSFGTGFAQAGFRYDANLSPNNQAFSAAVFAVIARMGQPIEGVIAPFLPGGFNGFGTPTNLVSGTATAGTSTLAMRRDATPALDWGQAPTWTGKHNFNGGAPAIVMGTQTPFAWGGTSGLGFSALQIGNSGIFPVLAAGFNITQGCYHNGTSYIFTGTGTNNSGTSTGGVIALQIGGVGVYVTGAGTYGGTGTLVQVFGIAGTAGASGIMLRGYGPQAAGLVDMTPDEDTFQVTLTGITPSVTGTLTARRMGDYATLTGSFVGTSNANAMTVTGVPAAWRAGVNTQLLICNLEDNSANCTGAAQFTSGGSTITFLLGGVNGTRLNNNSAGFTASGQKGLNATVIGPYLLA